MPDQTTIRIPKYRLHRPTGLGVVRLNGHDVYLGLHGTPESRQKYERVIAEWLANGRVLPPRPPASAPTNGLAMCELMLAFLEHAKRYYVKNGKSTGEHENVGDALRPVAALFDKTPVATFGPQSLKAVRDSMIRSNLARTVINCRINRIRRMVKWGVENQLVEPAVLQALQAVSPLKRGRCDAKETAPVEPVADERVDAVLLFVPRQIAAMIQVQRLTGMRPGEVLAMRLCEIDRSGDTWCYSPSSHKTEHHGKARVVFLGPRAQVVLRPFMNGDPEAYLFNPRDAVEEHHRARRLNRKTPMTPSQGGRRRKIAPARVPGARYTRRSYAVAIARACDRAFLPSAHLSDDDRKQWKKEHRWTPNQLRHTAATVLRRAFGIEAARVVLGHTSSVVTEIYAALDQSKAADIMSKVG
jgi:integrase